MLSNTNMKFCAIFWTGYTCISLRTPDEFFSLVTRFTGEPFIGKIDLKELQGVKGNTGAPGLPGLPGVDGLQGQKGERGE